MEKVKKTDAKSLNMLFNQVSGCPATLFTFDLDLQFFAQDPSKTEEATPRRKTEARKKGQVAKSQELNSIIVLLALFLFLNFFGYWLYVEFLSYLTFCLSPQSLIISPNEVNLQQILWQHLIFFGRIFLPLGLGAMIVGIAINYFQVGAFFTVEPLMPKFSRINPLNGLQRLFSMQSVVELAKSMIKLAVVSYFAYSTIRDRLFVLLDTVQQTPLNVAITIWDILFQVSLKICLFLFVIAALDYAYQRWEFRKSLRMSKQEVREEFKQTEGNPLIKNKIRQRQRQMAMRRMMQDVPKADVVITNPTHIAIALRYDATVMTAPALLAKGEGYIAEKIKEIAKASGVPFVENKPLAQTLYKTVEIGDAIPAQLYQAVAEVLAFVYRLKQRRA